ncbi:hypothetical protein, partial [Zhenpiania hominis]|uniref:hypothetical protein n=1 Tax=Zhenpiania hominis TaxID=2763644 RepID=UPI0039F4901B
DNHFGSVNQKLHNNLTPPGSNKQFKHAPGYDIIESMMLIKSGPDKEGQVYATIPASAVGGKNEL